MSSEEEDEGPVVHVHHYAYRYHIVNTSDGSAERKNGFPIQSAATEESNSNRVPKSENDATSRITTVANRPNLSVALALTPNIVYDFSNVNETSSEQTIVITGIDGNGMCILSGLTATEPNAPFRTDLNQESTNTIVNSDNEDSVLMVQMQAAIEANLNAIITDTDPCLQEILKTDREFGEKSKYQIIDASSEVKSAVIAGVTGSNEMIIVGLIENFNNALAFKCDKNFDLNTLISILPQITNNDEKYIHDNLSLGTPPPSPIQFTQFGKPIIGDLSVEGNNLIAGIMRSSASTNSCSHSTIDSMMHQKLRTDDIISGLTSASIPLISGCMATKFTPPNNCVSTCSANP